MVELQLYDALVIDIDDKTKKRRVKIRILPEHKDVREDDLPWASPYFSINSNKEFENDLPIKDSIIGVFVDKFFKRFYYTTNKFFYDLFDYSKVDSTLSKASSITNKDYKNIKFRLYEDGGLEFHNKSDGSHGFIHKSGSYSVFDKDGNLYTKTKKANIESSDKIIIDGSLIELNGNTKSFVTHAELDLALQSYNTQLAAFFTALYALLGTPYPGATIDISAAKTNTVKTG